MWWKELSFKLLLRCSGRSIRLLSVRSIVHKAERVVLAMSAWANITCIASFNAFTYYCTNTFPYPCAYTISHCCSCAFTYSCLHPESNTFTHQCSYALAYHFSNICTYNHNTFTNNCSK